jgi:tetrapyrrole methylase family protein/MazG family protein
LAQAQEYQNRAARVGFDWPKIEGVYDKFIEELDEVRSAGEDQRAFEIGDLLFAAVNLARWYHVDGESAMREANSRFRRRFSYIEKSALLAGRSLTSLTLDEMEEYWQKAKGETDY